MTNNPSADVKKTVVLGDGKKVEVGRITLRGLMKLADVLKAEGVLGKLKGISDEANIFDLVQDTFASAPIIAKTFISVTTGIPEADAEALAVDDALLIVEAALEINNPEKYWPTLKKVLGLATRIVPG